MKAMEFTGHVSSDESFQERVGSFLSSFGPESDVVVWGCGKGCEILIDTLRATHRIRYLVDSNDRLWGKRVYGYEVKSPESLRQDRHGNVKVIVVPFGFVRYDIAKVLVQYGFDDEHFCFGNEYLVLHHFHYHRRIVIPNLGFFIGSACTLRCRDCIAHLAYYAKNRNTFIPFETIKRDIDLTFQTVSFINLITLSTGEIFLHPDINRILEYLYTYRDCYKVIQTPTNGTIVPKPETLDVMKRCNIGVYISDYSHVVGKRSRIPQLTALLDQYQIANETFSDLQGGASAIPLWSDIGDFFTERRRSQRETSDMYQRCANRAAQVVYDGRLYTCGSAPWGEFGGLYEPMGGSDYVDLSQGNTAVLRAYFGATETGYPHVCTRCNGIGSYANPKTVYAGIQLNSDDGVAVRPPALPETRHHRQSSSATRKAGSDRHV